MEAYTLFPSVLLICPFRETLLKWAGLIDVQPPEKSRLIYDLWSEEVSGIS